MEKGRENKEREREKFKTDAEVPESLADHRFTAV